MIQPIRWSRGTVEVLDQRQLPGKVRHIRCRSVETLARAVESLAVRGAPLIGIAGAYGVALGMWHGPDGARDRRFRGILDRMARTRPTAVNLFWALARMERAYRKLSINSTYTKLRQALLREARAIHREDADLCRRIGSHGSRLLSRGWRVLTHCNTGSLATGGIGTALGIIRTARRQGKMARVYVDETRPLLQGARLTMWELGQSRIPATLICDNMAAWLMARGKVDCVIVGADRIAANGDAANKIGTYGLAVLARHHRVPFYVAAPSSTFDLSIGSGSDIPIEHRQPDEVTAFGGRPTAPAGAGAHNPAFDVTPGRLISAIVTERGVLRPPYACLRKKLSL